ncbi:hypothetical protein Tdes44962_MAKER02935 [Teratosphaeria destructans]|uniref:Uncharacterized protein n=1 Tax=Teratosphaeria destructans TaxID=418781 RepID=A0A9W7SRJ8_9PEZI|nr:hypothetical protein Tdes44962_MAKER02935 [Teratosphaeria destructans]
MFLHAARLGSSAVKCLTPELQLNSSKMSPPFMWFVLKLSRNVSTSPSASKLDEAKLSSASCLIPLFLVGLALLTRPLVTAARPVHISTRSRTREENRLHDLLFKASFFGVFGLRGVLVLALRGASTRPRAPLSTSCLRTADSFLILRKRFSRVSYVVPK